MTEWFEQWFGEEYLKLYPHRDEVDAARAVSLVAGRLQIAGKLVLDLACGPGRHAVHLRRAGANVVGFDLSLPLLSRARHRDVDLLPVVRGDMRRLPFKPCTFDVVVNLFTSFGYFSDDAQHQLVLRDVAAVLRVGGVLLLDYFNADELRRYLVEREELSVGGQQVLIQRRISSDGGYVIKEIHLIDDGRSFVERVRLFDQAELENLVRDAGLEVRDRFGDYDGSPVTERSPRFLLTAERP